MTKKTLEKRKAEEALHQRILRVVDRVFNAQLALAEGITRLYRIDETGKGKDRRREHVLVTDPDEIKEVLDETDAAGGVVDDHYYYITTKVPDNKAIDSMLDRVFGRALTKTQVTGKDDGAIQLEWLSKFPTNPGAGPKPSTRQSSGG